LYDLEESKRLKIFLSNESNENKIVQNIEGLTEGTNVKDLQLKQIDKVISNPKSKAIENNNYRTIIGMLAETSSIN